LLEKKKKKEKKIQPLNHLCSKLSFKQNDKILIIPSNEVRVLEGEPVFKLDLILN